MIGKHHLQAASALWPIDIPQASDYSRKMWLEKMKTGEKNNLVTFPAHVLSTGQVALAAQ